MRRSVTKTKRDKVAVNAILRPISSSSRRSASLSLNVPRCQFVGAMSFFYRRMNLLVFDGSNTLFNIDNLNPWRLFFKALFACRF